jgi:Fic family protein
VAFEPRFTITNPIAAALTRIERARGFLEAARLSEAWIATTRSRAFLLEAHHTTHIEGTRLTLDQAGDLLAGRAVPDADPDDAREVLNYREAFELVSEYMNEGGPVTEGLIKEIHRRLVSGVRGGAAAPGRYREQQNYVVDTITFQLVYRPPPPEAVPGLVKELVAWLNAPGGIHPVLAAGAAQFQFVHIHPFLDGNGRTSRLLSTLCLYRAGYDFKRLFTISEFYDRDRPAFYKAIQDVRDNGMDLTGWLEYFAGGLAVQLGEVQAQGDRALRTDAAVRRLGLGARQALALGHVLEHGSLTIADFERLCPGVNRRTLQRDLRELVDKKLLASQGATNRLQYIAGKGLT